MATKPSTQNFYETISHSDGYNLKDRRYLINRPGIKKVIAFDDRFLTVTQILTHQINALSKQSKILDVGCGDGVYESLLSPTIHAQAKFYGIDISLNQLKKSQQLFTQLKQVDFDHQPIPYPDNYFDLVICSEVLEHLFSPEHTLQEIHRVLKPKGTCIITVPNLGAIYIRLGLLFSASNPTVNYPANKPHIRFYNHQDILTLTKPYFKLSSSQGTGSFLFGQWNAGFYLPTPRILQQFGNHYLKNLAGGLVFTFQNQS